MNPETTAKVGGSLLLALVLALAVGRFLITPEPITVTGVYKFVAHAVVVVLITTWLLCRHFERPQPWIGYLALFLCVVEVVAFGLGRLV